MNGLLVLPFEFTFAFPIVVLHSFDSVYCLFTGFHNLHFSLALHFYWFPYSTFLYLCIPNDMLSFSFYPSLYFQKYYIFQWRWYSWYFLSVLYVFFLSFLFIFVLPLVILPSSFTFLYIINYLCFCNCLLILFLSMFSSPCFIRFRVLNESITISFEILEPTFPPAGRPRTSFIYKVMFLLMLFFVSTWLALTSGDSFITTDLLCRPWPREWDGNDGHINVFREVL